jgi:hypothetical protein
MFDFGFGFAVYDKHQINSSPDTPPFGAHIPFPRYSGRNATNQKNH